MIRRIKKRWGLTISLVIFIFLIILTTMILGGGFFAILHHIGVLNFFDGARPDFSSGRPVDFGIFPFRGVLSMIVFSVFFGTVIAWFFSKTALRPIRKIIEATHKVASGDFNVKLDIHGIYELEELSGSFNKMAYELSGIETLRNDFINSFSHELKTPISSIRGFAKLLKNETLDKEDKQEYLNIIITESERLTSLSENILNLAKYENLEIIADITEIRMDELVRKAVIQMEPKWLAKEINIIVETEVILFNGNADLIQQVLLNLIDNAIKYTESGGNITIRLIVNKDGLYLIVKDDGIGMDDMTKERIFDKFYQADISRAGKGHGLGLSIVKRIINLCGGLIEVHSEQHEGSEFIVWLPMM